MLIKRDKPYYDFYHWLWAQEFYCVPEGGILEGVDKEEMMEQKRKERFEAHREKLSPHSPRAKKTPRDEAPDGMRRCRTCGELLPIERFAKKKRVVSRTCYACTKDKRYTHKAEVVPEGCRKCRVCGKVMKVEEFPKSYSKKGERLHLCYDCTRDRRIMKPRTKPEECSPIVEVNPIATVEAEPLQRKDDYKLTQEEMKQVTETTEPLPQPRYIDNAPAGVPFADKDYTYIVSLSWLEFVSDEALMAELRRREWTGELSQHRARVL